MDPILRTNVLPYLKIISGGQSGVDTLALTIAKHYGIETGGYMPDRFLRYDNSGELIASPYFAAEFKMKEAQYDREIWPTRTRLNAESSHLTLWFGEESPGYFATKKAVKPPKKFLNNPTVDEAEEAILHILANVKDLQVVVNVAGNRHHTHPASEKRCQLVLVPLFERLGDGNT